MFGKLLKHEFRATAPLVLLTWVAVIGFSGLSVLFGLLFRGVDIFWLPTMLTTFFAVIFGIASVAIVYVLVIRRFYVNVFGDEGYLTLTLPVKRSSIISAKLFCAVIWVISTIAVVIGAFTLRLMAENPQTLEELLKMLEITVERSADFSGFPIWAVAVELLVLVLVSLMKSIMLFYTAISLGQFFTGHRLLGTFISYLGLNAVGRAAVSLYSQIMRISQQKIDILWLVPHNYAPDSSVGFDLQVSVILYIALAAVSTAILWLLTDFIMRRAVNLR